LPPADSALDLTIDPGVPLHRKTKWVIVPQQPGLWSRLRELWDFRLILWFLASRTVVAMYEGTFLGKLWLFLRPLAPLIISAFVFGRLLNVPSGGVPYFLFFLTGLTTWHLFERSLLWVTRSLDMNKGLVKKVYFPRLIVPMSSVAPAVLELSIYTALLAGALLYYLVKDGRWYLVFGPQLLLAPVLIVLTVLLSIGLGFFTSVWQVRARDVRMTLRYVLRFWSYLTPVLYPLSLVPPEYRWLIYVNPMAPIVEAYKWSVLGIGELHLPALASGIGVIAVSLVVGAWYFSRSEENSIDKL
jgi:lipopolysaccharide transport system permease protein